MKRRITGRILRAVLQRLARQVAEHLHPQGRVPYNVGTPTRPAPSSRVR
jgi:hypothetical protein